MKAEIICSGFGGQGSLTIGQFLARAAMKEGKNVSWLPSYGPEMRGGTANVSVVISDEEIASPLVSTPDILVALNQPSVDRFGPVIREGGVVFINTDLSPKKLERDGIEIYYAPMNKIATECGSIRVLSMVSVGMVIGKTKLVQKETIVQELKELFEKNRPEIFEANIKALEKGIEIVE